MAELNPSIGHQGLVELRKRAKLSDLYLAYYLYSLKVGEKWRQAVGDGGFTTWDDYLKQPEIGITKAKADKLVNTYHGLVEDLEIDVQTLKNVPMTVLHKIWQNYRDGHITKEQVIDLIADGEHLSVKDFKEQLQDAKAGEGRTYTYVLMKKCNETGSLEKIHGISSEEIKTKLEL